MTPPPESIVSRRHLTIVTMQLDAREQQSLEHQELPPMKIETEVRGCLRSPKLLRCALTARSLASLVS